MKRLDRVSGQIKGGECSFERGVVLEDVVDRGRPCPCDDADRPTQIHVHPDEAPEALSFLVLRKKTPLQQKKLAFWSKFKKLLQSQNRERNEGPLPCCHFLTQLVH